jgi:microcystin-dependent protein
MPSTTYKGYTIPGFNTEVGTWGQDINNNYTSVVDLNIGGLTQVSLSSSNVTLSTGSSGQMQNSIIQLVGSILANITVSSSAQGFCFVENLCSGSFAVTWQANFGSGAVGSAVLLPAGSRTLIISDTSSGARPVVTSQATVPSGALQPFAGSSAPSGWLLCFGQAVSRTGFSGLFATIGTTYGTGDGSTTFNLPDLRGRAIFGLDNMGGSAAGRLTGSNTGNITTPTTLGGTGGEENHTSLIAEMPSHTHTPTVTDTGHSHTLGTGPFVSGSQIFLSNAASSIVENTLTTNVATTGISVSNANIGGGGSHNTTPPAMVVNWLIKT